MPLSWIPEKPIAISPSLAATVGLEEAVMLAILQELLLHHDGQPWLTIDANKARQFFPFWQHGNIQRIAASLRDKGMLQVDFTSMAGDIVLKVAAVTTPVPATATPVAVSAPVPAVGMPEPVTSTHAQRISLQWQPDAEVRQQIASYNIPDTFIRQMVSEFVSYWRDRGESHHAWGNRFLKHVLRQWREQDYFTIRERKAEAMHSEWRPGPDAMDILLRTEMDPQFIEDCLPEFILYWRDRGDISPNWDSKFIQHTKRQWAIYTETLKHDSTPKRLPADWQPAADVYDILRMANIDEAFARSLVSEFILYWRESNQVHASWNSKFLQHVKYQWANRHKLQTADYEKITGFIAKHTDNSWSEGL